MKRKEIEEAYIKKINDLIKFNKAYFDRDKPIISDRDYDILKKEILNLESKYNYLKSKNSPSQKIGHEPSNKFKKIKHLKPMLSLSNAFEKGDMKSSATHYRRSLELNPDNENAKNYLVEIAKSTFLLEHK